MDINIFSVECLHCDLCSYSTLKKYLLRKHVVHSHLEAKSFLLCEQCGVRLRTLWNLKIHQLCYHTTENTWHCKQCDCSYKSCASLRNHVRSKHKHPRYCCNECEFTTEAKSKLVKHIEKHLMGFLYFKCDTCKFSTREQHILQSHQLRHQGPKPFICPLCDKRFSVQRGLDQHHVLQHSPSPPLFDCKICDAKFKQKSHLTRHFKFLHSQLKTNKICRQCKKEFSNSYDFKVHRKLHVGHIHSCKECKYSTTYPQAMKQHQMKHDNIKPHACDYCLKTFRRPYLMRKHVEKYH